MRPFYTLLLPFTLLFVSCEKDYSYEGGTPIPPVTPPVVVPPVVSEIDQFKQILTDNKFQLRAFYSDIPIDFNPDDNQVNLETDLWQHVAFYLKDDVNTFYENGEVKIEQNHYKRPGLDDAELTRQYAITEDSDGLILMFLDATYNPLQYRIAEVGDNYFILSVEWTPGVTVYSRFEAVE
ncbi:MAG: hypothetical protein J7497_03545 [Chitinophagaceae bacterium]|nr:hypothetical protein [Chitinophagaceae bacterium]